MDLMDHVEDYVKDLRGNHRKFDSFAWFNRPEDDENWCIVYTHSRDSGIVVRSNAACIEKELTPFTEGEDPDAVPEVHNHWACGWVDGYAIRVLDPDGKPTAAFVKWVELQLALEDYPILDEDDVSEREDAAVCEDWENMRLEDRIEVCKRAGVSIFAARRDYPEGEVYYQLRDDLASNGCL